MTIEELVNIKRSRFQAAFEKETNFCFINNSFDVNLKAWRVNMDIQPVFNEYKRMTYMWQCFSKTEDQSLQALKQAAKKTFENKMHHHETMKLIATGYFRS